MRKLWERLLNLFRPKARLVYLSEGVELCEICFWNHELTEDEVEQFYKQKTKKTV